MTTPTREQVIEWAKEAGLSFEDGWIFHTSKRRSLPAPEIDAFVAAMNAAHTAGRVQGLREAKEATKREFCEWGKLPTNALDVMKELGNFGPTVNAAHREVKGYMLDDEGDGVSRYWSSDDLRNIANGCNDVAEWLDQRAAIEQLRV